MTVDSQKCRVQSTTIPPKVWDQEISTEVNPRLLRKTALTDNTTEEFYAFEGLEFPTESNEFFKSVTTEQASASGLPAVMPRTLPIGFGFIAKDPYGVGTVGQYWFRYWFGTAACTGWCPS